MIRASSHCDYCYPRILISMVCFHGRIGLPTTGKRLSVPNTSNCFIVVPALSLLSIHSLVLLISIAVSGHASRFVASAPSEELCVFGPNEHVHYAGMLYLLHTTTWTGNDVHTHTASTSHCESLPLLKSRRDLSRCTHVGTQIRLA